MQRKSTLVVSKRAQAQKSSYKTYEELTYYPKEKFECKMSDQIN